MTSLACGGGPMTSLACGGGPMTSLACVGGPITSLACGGGPMTTWAYLAGSLTTEGTLGGGSLSPETPHARLSHTSGDINPRASPSLDASLCLSPLTYRRSRTTNEVVVGIVFRRVLYRYHSPSLPLFLVRFVASKSMESIAARRQFEGGGGSKYRGGVYNFVFNCLFRLTRFAYGYYKEAHNKFKVIPDRWLVSEIKNFISSIRCTSVSFSAWLCNVDRKPANSFRSSSERLDLLLTDDWEPERDFLFAASRPMGGFRVG
ncbi:hypothetical protein LXL04_024220 [Taraxacum kok-saghyz]